MQRSVYLDYAATTPMDERVLEAMRPFFMEKFGNPNSLYGLGREAYKALEDAREIVQASLNAAHPNEVIFTSGGTESDNAALFGITAAAAAKAGRHVVVSAFEHHGILEPAQRLSKMGFEVEEVRPREDGIIHAEDLRAILRDDTVLVSVMMANNEIGTIQPIAELASATHEKGAYFHTDAVQALGKMEVDVQALGVDAASFSGHKIYGPKGCGVLYLRKGVPFESQMLGGGQEFRKRSGTQNVAGATGFAKAIQLMDDERPTETGRLTALRDKLVEGVLALENTQLNGSRDNRLPNIANLIIKGIEGEAMLLQLDAKGISVSTGSACSSGSLKPSHVLLSIGCPPELAHGSLRATVGRHTTEEDVDYFLEVFPPIVERLRAMSPVYAKMFGSTGLAE